MASSDDVQEPGAPPLVGVESESLGAYRVGADIVIAAVLAVGGIAMHALPVTVVLGCLAGAALLALAIDFL